MRDSGPVQIDEIPLVSADSHVEEPTRLWIDNLPSGWRDSLPKQLMPDRSDAAEFGDRIGVEEKEVASHVGVHTDTMESFHSHADAEGLTEDEKRARTSDPDSRYEVLRRDGVCGECIFPTIGLGVWAAEGPDVQRAACEIYNDWIFDRLESRSPRFRCAALIPIGRIEDALAEVKRVGDMGLAAAMIPLVGTPPYNDRLYEPLWSLLEELRMPVVMHQGTGHDMIFYRRRGAAIANLLATQSMAPRSAALFAASGVLQDHPHLQLVFVETNASWIPWAMSTLDFYYKSFQAYPGWVRPLLEEPPSYYIKRQVHGTFQYDPVAISTVGVTGPTTLLWGSDYPHAEGTYPDSRAVVAELAMDLPPEYAPAVFGGTAAALFGFDSQILTSPV